MSLPSCLLYLYHLIPSYFLEFHPQGQFMCYFLQMLPWPPPLPSPRGFLPTLLTRPPCLSGFSMQTSCCYTWTCRYLGALGVGGTDTTSFIQPRATADKLGKYLLIECKDNSSVPFTLLLSLSGRTEKVIPAALASIPSP